jgi:hypothetical protein
MKDKNVQVKCAYRLKAHYYVPLLWVIVICHYKPFVFCTSQNVHLLEFVCFGP